MKIPDRITKLFRAGAETKGIPVPVSSAATRHFAVFADRLPGADMDYAALAGDPWLNGVVRAASDWIAGNYSQCRPAVQAINADGVWEDAPGHPLEALLRRPSPQYGGRTLRRMIAQSLLTTGNCFLLLDRDGARRVRGLTWIPSGYVRIEWAENDPERPITRYWYQPRGQKIPYDPADILHLRMGADPAFAGLMGVAPVQTVLRELASDNQLSTRYAALLRNGGAIPFAVTPKEVLTPEEQEQLAEDFNNGFSGEGAGRFAVFSSPLEFTRLSYSPDEMAAGDIRADIIRRIAASMGVPVAVLGLAPDGTTFSNVREMTKNVWETRTLSDLALLAEEIEAQLLPEFERQPERYRLVWDTGEVAALQDDENDRAKRADMAIHSGGVSQNEYRQMIGLPPVDRTASGVDPDLIRGEPAFAASVARGNIQDATPDASPKDTTHA